MYNYDLKNEKIIHEIVDTLISIDESELIGNVLITEDKILIFRNLKRNSVLSGRGIHEIPEYELLLEIDSNKLEYEIEDNNTVLNLKEMEVILFNFDFKKIKNG